MTFIKGSTVELRVLQETEREAHVWTDAVMRGLTLQFTLTGSVPMRYIDIKDVWERDRKAGAVQFGLWSKGKFIGTVGLYSPREVYRSYEFRILIFDKDAVGRGIGSEATWLATDYGFRNLNAWRIWLGVNAENLGAVRVYEKTGYRKEGVLRDDIYCYGKYVNAIRYSMLRPEWEGLCRVQSLDAVGMLRDIPAAKGRKKCEV